MIMMMIIVVGSAVLVLELAQDHDAGPGDGTHQRVHDAGGRHSAPVATGRPLARRLPARQIQTHSPQNSTGTSSSIIIHFINRIYY